MGYDSLNHPSLHRTWIEIDLSAIMENIRRFQRHIGPNVEIMALIKANAYGHGAVEVAKAALSTGATRLGVANCLEGEELRREGITAPIHILGALLPEEVESAVHHDLVISLHDLSIARLASLAALQQGRDAVVHLKVDTGMGRLGVLPAEIVHVATEITKMPSLNLEGIFMHFAKAIDEIYTHKQLACFNATVAELQKLGIGPLLRHCANSTAAILYPESHYDMIRPGIGLYGMHDPEWLADKLPLVPVLSWKTLVVQVKEYPAGMKLGYNCTFTTSKNMRIAIMPVGYADGYRRGLSNLSDVLINQQRARVVGMVSMDHIMADVTQIPEVFVGSEVTLIGTDGEERITAEELASHLPDAIPYEFTACLGQRIGKCFFNHASSQKKV
ncbi:MAG: alanine racemase [Planctomycetes bacterium]|nr:alanine racemase [Planctomycetota bacterium]